MASTPQQILSVLLVYPGIFAVCVVMLSWSTTMDILMLIPGWIILMFVVNVCCIIAAAFRSGRVRGEDGAPLQVVKRSLPAATVTLRTHHLVIRCGATEESILLGDIDRVTNDKAGARIRVQGRMRYLLPDRADAERAWLAELLRSVVQTRKSGGLNSDVERAKLEKLLQRT